MAESFGDAFQKHLNRFQIDQRFKQAKIRALWKNMFGPAIVKRTDSIWFKGRTMYVQINSAPLRQELTNSRELILKRIHEDIDPKIINEVVIR